MLMPTHFGTHADAYSHFRRAGGTIDRMDLVSYIGAAVVLGGPPIRALAVVGEPRGL